MKVKIKKTGEIYNIAEYDQVEVDTCDSYGNPLTFDYDEVEFIQEKSSDIDWEQRRYEIARNILSSMCGDKSYDDTSIITMVNTSISIADTLIKELKGENK